MRSQRLFWVLLVVALLGWSATAQQDAAVVVGELSAAEHEADEGYFALGQNVTVMTKPGTELHGWLRGHVGQRLKVTLEPDTGTDQ